MQLMSESNGGCLTAVMKPYVQLIHAVLANLHAVLAEMAFPSRSSSGCGALAIGQARKW